MTRKISYNNFSSKKISGGALHYYNEISRLLADSEALDKYNIQADSHNIFDLVNASDKQMECFAEYLSNYDTVVCNSGIYGFIYHYIREKYKADFNIVRDVQTSSWSGYFLQEWLIQSLSREGDLSLFPSEFCRQYFISVFPEHITEINSRVCYPMQASLPEDVVKKNMTDKSKLKIGYIGRISPGKNFGQVMRVFAKHYKQTNGNAKFIFAGFPERSAATIKKIKHDLEMLGINKNDYQYLGDMPYRKIWNFYSKIDVLLFPSMASVESLGRVIIEAAWAGVPVIAGAYAAAPELIDASNVVKCKYKFKDFMLNRLFAFGEIDEQDALRVLNSFTNELDASTFSQFQSDTFYNLLVNSKSINTNCELTQQVERFIDSLEFKGISKLSKDETLHQCKELVEYFKKYHNNSLLNRIRLVHEGIKQYGFKNNPYIEMYMNRLFIPNDRLILGHARVFCEFSGFNPTVSVRNE